MKMAAKNALTAGFDGVEIHGANGYLIDQFLHYHTNHRNDEYGSKPENMARFALEVIKACGEAIGYERVGIRLSPGAYLNEIVGDMRDGLVFQYLLEQLNRLPIAYVHTGSFDDTLKYKELDNKTTTEFIRTYYRGTLVACGGYTLESAYQGIASEQFDLVAMGRLFIANPEQAQTLLPQGLCFCLYEGYRSLTLQKMLFDNRFKKLKQLHPHWSDDQLFIETTKLVSPVINQDGSKNVPPHSTGSAVDVYLIDETEDMVDMGMHPKDWMEDEDGSLSMTDSQQISTVAKRNRKIMSEVLSAVGFVNYPTEYWHWSYGDRYWAYHKQQPYAIYGEWHEEQS